MKFTKRFNLEGLHAPFSASKYSWLNYDDEKTLDVYANLKAKERGTRLHAWAKETIDLGIKQPRSPKTLYSYVNDAIGYGMDTEVLLYYSDYFFGTADAISFKKNLLRIHDLKTGKTPAHMEQLLIYAALFCLDYGYEPENIKIELRIYQNDEIDIYNPEPDEVSEIMDKIIHLNALLEQYDLEG